MVRAKYTTLRNAHAFLTVDALGRIVSLRNLRTGTELISHPRANDAWRIIIPTGRHTLGFVMGSEQSLPRITRAMSADGECITIAYHSLRLGKRTLQVRARFTLALAAGSGEITCRAEIENHERCPVDEVEFPILSGLGGFPDSNGQRAMRLVTLGGVKLLGHNHGDVLHRPLPETGCESNHFARGQETAMFPVTRAPLNGAEIAHFGLGADLHNDRQGLYAGLHDKSSLFAFKIEKFPKEFFHGARNSYPGGTPRWLSLFGLHMPQVQPGAKWTSPPVVLLPHAGDWHAGADRYRAFRLRGVTFCQPPAWMKDFVGWSAIIGKLYTGEVFFDYARCAKAIIAEAKVTGQNLVYYYGHTKLGAEGADFDHGPARDMGGVDGFRRMIATLHKHGIRIMLLDHFHRWINRDVPEYRRLGLERFAVRDSSGALRTERWWKETGLSCLYFRGPTPEWVEMCPSCPGWREHYLRHMERLIRLGVDALELDTFLPSVCHSKHHPHRPGANIIQAKLDFIREARQIAKRLNPDFALFGEAMLPEARTVVDGYLSFRYFHEDGVIHRYLFPELREQAVTVGNYGYDQINKALQLGIGIDTQIWGLRTTALEGCPELARYLGEVNRFRRKYASVLMNGVFRDTLGATVNGDVFYSVLDGRNGEKALVLRNPHERAVKVTARLDGSRGKMILWCPSSGERVARLPLRLALPSLGVAVLLVTPGGPQ